MTIKAKHKNRAITFDPQEHVYRDDRNCLYTSATTLVKSFFPPFDSAKVASFCANKGKYKDMSVNDVLDAWEIKRNNAADKGNAIHEMAEELITERKDADDYANSIYSKYVSIIMDIKHDLKNKGWELVECEKIVFSPKFLVSGTVDAIFRHKDTGEYMIVDWKTNEEIKQKNYRTKAYEPLHYLDDCNYNHYALQLNVYEELLVSEGYYPFFDFKKTIVHIKEDDFEYYEIETMKKELDVIMGLF